MAFDVFIGSQGSGKSLTSIHYLFEDVEIINGESKKEMVPRYKQYKRLITCVGGFNVDKFKEIIFPYEIEVIHYDKFLYREDLVEIFQTQMQEKDKPQDERTPTLFLYDECQFGLDIFSQTQALLETCSTIRNFFSLQRHYGPTDTVLMTQARKNISDKYLPEDFNLYISLERAKKSDPNNDIIFDMYKPDGKEIAIGGRNKIKYKKDSKKIVVDKKEYNPFDLYVSGDGGRKAVSDKQFWRKYIWILLFLVSFSVISLFLVFYYMFDSFDKTSASLENKENNVTVQQPKNTTVVSVPPPQREPTIYDDYVKEPYENINTQIMIKVFSSKGVYYVGSQILTLESFQSLINKNVLFIVSTQPITKNSFYVNVLIHQSILNSFGIVKDFDSSNDKRLKSSLKRGL